MLVNSLRQMMKADDVVFWRALARHIGYAWRRCSGGFPFELHFSRSVLLAMEPSGVVAMVNSMGLYDYNNMMFLTYLLKNRCGTSVVDVGANLGCYSLLASEVTGSRILAIEPHPVTFGHLANNIRLNRRSSITAVQCAISDYDGDGFLTDLPERSVNHLDNAAGRDLIPVRCRSLAALCQEVGIRPELVKIDVEGAEQQVIRSLGEAISFTQAIFVEAGDRKEVAVMLQAEGLLGPLYVHFKEKSLTREPRPRAEDAIYVRPDLVQRLRQDKWTVSCVDDSPVSEC